MPEAAAETRQIEGFSGLWRIERRIEDRLAGRGGRFAGTLRIGPLGGGTFEALETGTLELDGAAPLAAERRHLWRADGDGIAVLFPDGRPFHRIGPGPAPAATHLCGADLYRVAYDFSGWPVWRALWRVTGPRKDYTLDSTLDRAE